MPNHDQGCHVQTTALELLNIGFDVSWHSLGCTSDTKELTQTPIFRSETLSARRANVSHAPYV